MALPVAIGDNPKKESVTKDTWTKVSSAVNISRITLICPDEQEVYMTYVTAAGTAPSGLTGAKWPVKDKLVEFEDSVTTRDIYLYPVGANITVLAEA